MFIQRRQDNQEEQQLRAELQRALRQGLEFHDYPGKDKLRAFLLNRQGHRCAYCERRINDKRRTSKKSQADTRRAPTNKIEHFHPQSSVTASDECRAAAGCNELHESSLELTNLLAVCAGQTDFAGVVSRHCDTSKANTDICAQLKNPNTAEQRDPSAPELGSLVVVERDGTVRPNPAYFPGEEEMKAAQDVLNDVLNLNAIWLKEARAKLYALLTRGLVSAIKEQSRKHHNVSRRQLRQKIVRARLKTLETKAPEFPSVYLSFCVENSQ
ncbi:hypothetical protein HMPREF3170_10505 [Corynebacterium sp. HMSC08D02]|nr:hypothetical protein HMPREF3170_10505 [Corynebacterium sp. HMSC08D02]